MQPLQPSQPMQAAYGRGRNPASGPSPKNYCFVCGERGHLSRQCQLQSQVPLCYNCKQPGHNSNQCPQPRAPKSCFRCQSQDHLSSDCPLKILAKSADRAQAICYLCSVKGHYARECPSHLNRYSFGVGTEPSISKQHDVAHTISFAAPRTQDVPFKTPSYIGEPATDVDAQISPVLSSLPTGSLKPVVVCRRCNGPGHMARNCPSNAGYPSTQAYYRAPFAQPPLLYQPNPTAMQVICLRCGMPGHTAKFCRNPILCWFCRKTGHISKDCPQARRCFCCGDMGHVARDCPARQAFTQPTPSAVEDETDQDDQVELRA